MDNSITVRRAREEDAQGMWELINELAVYEKSGPEHEVSPEQLAKDLKENHFQAFVAETADGGLAGMALCYPIYSTWKGRSLYLEDIIVREPKRRSGIGSRLFSAVVQFAKETGAGRLGWQVLDWNEPAIEFYKKYKAALDPEWINCRMTRKQIEEYIPE